MKQMPMPGAFAPRRRPAARARRLHGPFVAGSGTSQQSGAAIGRLIPNLRDLVLEAFRRAGASGLTDEEAQERTGLDPSTERPRRVELVRARLVMDSGRKRTTKHGRPATVWTIAEGT